MPNALMSRPTEPLPDGRDVQPGKVPGMSEPQVDLRRIYIYSCVLLLAFGFAVAAYSWVEFGRQEGIPVGLFTDTDFPAVVIASRLIAAGYGSQMYDHDAQLAAQRQLTRQGFLRLRPDDPELHYP